MDRVTVVQYEGKACVKLVYDECGGQILRPDILADPEKLARYIRYWADFWAHEDASHPVTGPVVEGPATGYDPEKFFRFLQADRFLAYTYEQRRHSVPDEELLPALFNTFVVEDSVLLAAYRAS